MVIVCFVLQVFSALCAWAEHYCNSDANVTYYLRLFAVIPDDDPHAAVQERIAQITNVFTFDKNYTKVCCDPSAPVSISDARQYSSNLKSTDSKREPEIKDPNKVGRRSPKI